MCVRSNGAVPFVRNIYVLAMVLLPKTHHVENMGSVLKVLAFVILHFSVNIVRFEAALKDVLEM